MKKIYQLIMLLILTTSSFGQNKIENVNLTYGEELPEDGQKIVRIVGETSNKIYALAIKGKDDYYIKTFESASMKILSSNEIKIPDMDDKEVDFEEIFMLNGKVYVIGSIYNKKSKIFNLTATQVSDEGILDKNSTVLFDAEVAKKSKRGDFYFKLSPDESTLLIMHTSEFPKEDAIKYDVKLFDENLKALFSNVEKVKFDDSRKDYEFSISDFEVNFQNDVFLVINESYRDTKKKEQIEKFEVHTFKAQKNYAKEVVNIDIKDKEIINCSLLSTNKNTLKVVGFYSSVRDNGKANKELKGVYNGTINLASNQVESVKFNEFDYETKVKLIGERRAKKGKDVKPLYTITTIIEKNDGGLIVLSEYQLRVVGKSSGIGPLALTPITYIKNEIIVTCLKPDGSLEWSNVVPKDQQAAISVMSIGLGVGSSSGSFTVGGGVQIPITQMGKGPEYLGAIPIYKDGVLSILINDNVKNKGITDIEEIKALGNYNKAVPALFIFDNTGKMSRKDPEEVIKNELVLRPGVYYRKSDKEFIVYSSRKKKDKLGRLVLEN
jgi:hypothetical protein